MRLRSLYEESGSRQLTGSGNVPHVIFTRQFWRLTATFRTGSCDVLSTSKRSLKGCSTFWPHIQVRHWNSYWVRSVTYDRVLSADIYGIRMANKKMIDMRAFLMRCLKLSQRDCTTNGLKLDKCKAWLRHLNASSIKESSNLQSVAYQASRPFRCSSIYDHSNNQNTSSHRSRTWLAFTTFLV